MEMVPVYRRSKNGSDYLYLISPAECDICKEPLKNSAVIFCTWRSRHEMDRLVLCGRCAADSKNHPVIMPNWRQGYVVVGVHEYRLTGSQPHFWRCPEFNASGGADVFGAAWSNKGVVADATGAEVVDRTRLAGRGDATFLNDAAPVIIGRDVRREIASKDRDLTPDEGLALLDSLAKAPPALPDGERERIEGDQ